MAIIKVDYGTVGGGSTERHVKTVNTINTNVVTEEIENGLVVVGMSSTTASNYQLLPFYGLISNGVITPIYSAYGNLPISGAFINLSYDSTTHKFTYATKSDSYKYGAIDIYVTPQPIENN